jgi:hypothetical protein
MRYTSRTFIRTLIAMQGVKTSVWHGSFYFCLSLASCLWWVAKYQLCINIWSNKTKLCIYFLWIAAIKVERTYIQSRSKNQREKFLLTSRCNFLSELHKSKWESVLNWQAQFTKDENETLPQRWEFMCCSMYVYVAQWHHGPSWARQFNHYILLTAGNSHMPLCKSAREEKYVEKFVHQNINWIAWEKLASFYQDWSSHCNFCKLIGFFSSWRQRL